MSGINIEFDPMVGTFWWYSRRPNNMWKCTGVTKDKYIFQTIMEQQKKTVKKSMFGKGWQQRESWDDFPPERRLPSASPPCHIQ
tara:strand:+ start:737 stop:988 length:252 start_codon:yes stop_codon:yes gene_type:complete